ncbi:hypothetical protein [Flectobacillus major]|uniref:hypothetical protein n=1 Tax=Flectobacillus major TaxID=103 RepID=UPI0003FCF252|nr:hypothetical protein [Flectobacillus major]
MFCIVHQFYSTIENKLLLFALLLYYCPLFAQKDLSDGYVVIFPNDTLRGQIVNKEWRKNLKTITFV